MPVMDGITAVREIMAASPTPILMFSSLTHDGARATLDALDAGALDFLPKKFEDIARNRDDAVASASTTCDSDCSKACVYAPCCLIAPRATATPATTASATSSLRPTDFSSNASAVKPAVASTAKFRASGKKYQLTAIGTSTGGPVALQKILNAHPCTLPTSNCVSSTYASNVHRRFC